MDVYIHQHVKDRLQAIGNRSSIINFINQLSSNPATLGDYRQADPRGRMIEVKILGRQAVLFFKDPFAEIVKILDIRNTEAI